MPAREDEELDSVTLHNLALVNIEKDPDDSFKKLNFLLKVLFNNNSILLVHKKH
jgi:tetratricopeptide repeat protein 30